MEMLALRDHVGKCLSSLYTDRMYVLDADLSKSTSTADFQTDHPDRFLQVGISEGSGVSIATGIAAEGMIPFYVNFALFCTGSAWTQLRQACYAKANLKLVGTHPGLDNGPDGPTHHSTEDLALARALPNLRILVPATLWELESAISLSMETEGPVYIRVARAPGPQFAADAPMQWGKALTLRDEGDDFAILFEGTCAAIALDAFEALKAQGKRGVLVNMRSLKPLDESLITALAGRVRRMVTVENHSVIGGLNAAAAQVLARLPSHPPLRSVAVRDTFAESGPTGQVKARYGLTTQAVVEALTQAPGASCGKGGCA